MALTDNLLAHWKLNEASGTRADSVNSYTLAEDWDTIGSTAGVIGDAVHMVSADSYYLGLVITPSTFAPETAYTATAWVRITSTYAAGDWMRAFGIVDLDNGRSPVSLEIDYITDGAYAYVYSNLSDESAVEKQHTTLLSKDVWYFLAVRWTGSKLGVSVNGGAFQEADQASLWQPGSYGANNVAQLGYRNATSRTHDVDSVSYWRNRALSESEINQLYNGGAGLDYPFLPSTVPIECVLADDLNRIIVQEA